MNTTWLAQLAPDRAPPVIGWWPPAPGWWALLLIGALLAAALFFWWRNPRRCRQRAALRELARIRAADADPTATAQAIQDLLRRYAIAVCGREPIARLSGAAWLTFLDTHGGFSGDPGRALLEVAYGARRVHPSHDVHDPASVLQVWREQWLLAAAQFIQRLRPAALTHAATPAAPGSAPKSPPGPGPRPEIGLS